MNWQRRTLGGALALLVLFSLIQCSKSSGPDVPPDVSAPRIIAINPDSTQANAPPDVQIEITFSEPMLPASADSQSIRLSDNSGVQIPCYIHVDGPLVALLPQTTLHNFERYRVVINQSVADLAGNTLEDRTMWHFRVEPYTTDSPETWVRILSMNANISSEMAATAVLYTGMGSYAVSGGGWDFGFASVDTAGTISWITTIPYSPSYVYVYDMLQTDKGDLIAFGDFSRPDTICAALHVVSSAGSLLRNRYYPIQGHSWGRSIVSLPSGEYLLCGWTWGHNARDGIYLCKTGNYGYPVWERVLGEDLPSTYYYGHAVTLCSTGGAVIVGERYDGSDHTMYAIRTDDTGAVLWEKPFASGILYNVISTIEGDYLAVGCGLTGFENPRLMAMRFDDAGTELWSFDLGSGAGRSVIRASDGNYVITGSAGMPLGSWSANVIAKITPAGQLLWRNELPIEGFGHDVCESPDGGFVIADLTYLIKVDQNGQVRLAQSP